MSLVATVYVLSGSGATVLAFPSQLHPAAPAAPPSEFVGVGDVIPILRVPLPAPRRDDVVAYLAVHGAL